jgi:alpha-mannosidase
MLHMIGYAHLDPVWLWRWPEGCAEAIGTCWAAIDRLEESDDFIFTRGEASIYQWIEELDPPLFARIRHFVQAGRWMIVGGWWVQPDCNLPSGEAFIRQALYGKNYFSQRFGVETSVGYNPDSFGHAATLPMLLRHTGSDSYVFMRPAAHEKTLPGELFDWVAPDGSRVIAFRIQVSYNSSPRNMQLDAKIPLHLQWIGERRHPFMCFYGVGNHGGGPTKENLAFIRERIAHDDRIRFSDPARFFASVRHTPRPEVTGGLQFHAIGCYSAASPIKALNRRAEAALEQADTAAALAWHNVGAAYPRATFEALWRRLLFNQFHDTLGGCTVESAWRDAIDEFGAVIAGANTELNAAVRRLAATVRTMDDARDPHLLVMNFTGDDCDDILEVEPSTDFEISRARVLVDENGGAVPFQQVAPDGLRIRLQRIAFRVHVPAFGYRLLRFVPGLPDKKSGEPGTRIGRTVKPAAAMFATTGWQLALDAATGAIQSLINTVHGQPLFSGLAHRGIVVDDPTDTWSHGVDRLPFDGADFHCERIAIVEEGPLRTLIEVAARHGESLLVTTIVLPGAAELPVELRVVLHWREHRRLLRLAYPLAGARFEYETAAGWFEHPDDGREVAAQRWVRAAWPGFAVNIVNDAKYGYAARDGVLFITAVRSPVFAHHDPMTIEPGLPYRTMDQGEQSFILRIQGAPDLTRRDAFRMTQHLLRPPVVTPHVARTGTRPWRGQWLEVQAEGACVTNLKQSEDGRALVLRALDLEGSGGSVRIGAGELAVTPRRIATARLEGKSLRRSNGLER